MRNHVSNPIKRWLTKKYVYYVISHSNNITINGQKYSSSEALKILKSLKNA